VSDGLTDHELLMEVRKDVAWIKENLGKYPTRKEVVAIFGLLISLGVAILAFV